MREGKEGSTEWEGSSRSATVRSWFDWILLRQTGSTAPKIKIEYKHINKLFYYTCKCQNGADYAESLFPNIKLLTGQLGISNSLRNIDG